MQEDLISSIYAAAAGRAPWRQPLTSVAQTLGLIGVQVIGVDKRRGGLIFNMDAGPSAPAAWLDYIRHYHQLNPRMQPTLALTLDGWMHCHEHFDDDYVAHNPFYQEFLIPYGGRFLTGTKLIENSDVLFIFGAMRALGSEPLGDREMPFLRTLKHHLTEAFRNYMHLRDTYIELQMARQLLDQFSYPMLLIDEAHGIWYRNPGAVKYLQGADVLGELQGTLVCHDSQAGAEIAAAVRDVSDAPADAIRRKAVRIPRKGLPPLFVFVSAIGPETSMQMLGPTVRYLLIIHDPLEASADLDPLILSECFGLTPAEARVAAWLTEGFDVKEIAQRHRTSVSTVRTQVRGVLDKTGTDRQTDLVRMLLSMPVRA